MSDERKETYRQSDNGYCLLDDWNTRNVYRMFHKIGPYAGITVRYRTVPRSFLRLVEGLFHRDPGPVFRLQLF